MDKTVFTKIYFGSHKNIYFINYFYFRIDNIYLSSQKNDKRNVLNDETQTCTYVMNLFGVE